MITPQLQTEPHANDSVRAHFPAVRWGALGVFCGLLLLWASALMIGMTLYGAIHIAFVLAVGELISSIRARDASGIRSANATTLPMTPISEQPQESNS